MIHFRCGACGIYHESIFQSPRAIYAASKRPGAGDMEVRQECPNTGRDVVYMLSDTVWRESEDAGLAVDG